MERARASARCLQRAKTAASPTPSVTRAHDAAVIRDDAAAVAVDEAEDELFGGLVDERLLPGLQSIGLMCFLPGPCWAGFRCRCSREREGSNPSARTLFAQTSGVR